MSQAVEIKIWNAGKADEAWKVMICARDAMRAEDIALGLHSILLGGSKEFPAALDDLSRMSGKQIADGLRAYHQCAINSVVNGLEPTR